MVDCGYCDGTTSMIEMNDDGETYTIHLHEDEKPVNVRVDFKTLKKLSSAIQIQLFLADKRIIEPMEEIA